MKIWAKLDKAMIVSKMKALPKFLYSCINIWTKYLILKISKRKPENNTKNSIINTNRLWVSISMTRLLWRFYFMRLKLPLKKRQKRISNFSFKIQTKFSHLSEKTLQSVSSHISKDPPIRMERPFMDNIFRPLQATLEP